MSIASKSALALSVLRQQNFRILRRFFRTSLTPAIRRYTCHALMSADFFRISRYFVRKLYSISVKIRKNPYTWRLWVRVHSGGGDSGAYAHFTFDGIVKIIEIVSSVKAHPFGHDTKSTVHARGMRRRRTNRVQ